MFRLNAFPSRSKNYEFSSREVITELTTNYKRSCKVDVGLYVEVSTNVIATNNNTERTTSSVALGPSANRQRSVKCFDIETGKVLICCTVTQMTWPLNRRLLQKVEAWDRRGVQTIKHDRIDFLNRNGKKFDWNNNDLSELEVIDDQPKLVDPEVTSEVTGLDEYDQDLRVKENEK